MSRQLDFYRRNGFSSHSLHSRRFSYSNYQMNRSEYHNSDSFHIQTSSTAADARARFEVDNQCQKCGTLEEALSIMHSIHGGFDEHSNRFLRSETTKKTKKGIWIFILESTVVLDSTRMD